ncbi:hypothetical protein SLE2022_040220 [Rubroshorea leprosula]
MAMIFEKTVEKPDLRQLKLPSDSKWAELPSAAATLDVRDQDNNTWNFNYSKSARNKASLGGKGWKDFVDSQDIKDRNKISLCKTGDFYTIKVEK